MASARACEAVFCCWRLLRTCDAPPAATNWHFLAFKSEIKVWMEVWRACTGDVSDKASFWERSAEPLTVVVPDVTAERRDWDCERRSDVLPPL